MGKCVDMSAHPGLETGDKSIPQKTFRGAMFFGKFTHMWKIVLLAQ